VKKRVMRPYSLARRLSWQLALQTMLVLALVFACLSYAISALHEQQQVESLEYRSGVISEILRSSAALGGEDEVVRRIESYAAMRSGTRLEVRRADGTLVYRDPDSTAHTLSRFVRSKTFSVATPGVPGGVLNAAFSVDFKDDAKLAASWVGVLVAVTLGGGALAAAGAWWRVRRGLRPLIALARQTRAISPRQLQQRLHLDEPAEELASWIKQFNALMDRLERTYAQLEGFNADVAHELRTPLANLIGQTELALSRERSAEALQDTLVSNLEELQRLSAIVNDMLFLSLADRGAVARRGKPVSLAVLARQVVEFHEAPIEEAQVEVAIDGDAMLAVDEALFKRALSNLLGNATRYAAAQSRITVRIAPDAADCAQVMVQNQGEQIGSDDLSRLFDRFFRIDSSRDACDTHHGLGLAIVAAIARMHAGAPLAESTNGTTRIGFTLAPG